MVDSFLTLFVLLIVLGVVAWALLGRRGEGTEKRRRSSPYRRRSPWARRIPILLIVVPALLLVGVFGTWRRSTRPAQRVVAKTPMRS